jgi:hypothetical protein
LIKEKENARKITKEAGSLHKSFGASVGFVDKIRK